MGTADYPPNAPTEAAERQLVLNAELSESRCQQDEPPDRGAVLPVLRVVCAPGEDDSILMHGVKVYGVVYSAIGRPLGNEDYSKLVHGVLALLQGVPEVVVRLHNHEDPESRWVFCPVSLCRSIYGVTVTKFRFMGQWNGRGARQAGRHSTS